MTIGGKVKLFYALGYFSMLWLNIDSTGKVKIPIEITLSARATDQIMILLHSSW